MGWREYPEEITDLQPDPVRFCPKCGEPFAIGHVCADARLCPECLEPVGPDGWCPDCGDGLIPGDEEEVEG